MNCTHESMISIFAQNLSSLMHDPKSLIYIIISFFKINLKDNAFLPKNAFFHPPLHLLPNLYPIYLNKHSLSNMKSLTQNPSQS